MSLTDLAGIAGLLSAALLALWMLLGAPNLRPTAQTGRHRRPRT
jgi:hypothetical protein